jgi:hypothetical protein
VNTSHQKVRVWDTPDPQVTHTTNVRTECVRLDTRLDATPVVMGMQCVM